MIDPRILDSAKSMQAFIQSATETRRFLERFRQENELIAKMYKDTIRKYLAERGWYVAGSLYGNQYPRLAKAVKEGLDSEIESFLQNHIHSSLAEIQEQACKKWPERERIICDAFEAHSMQKYTLSVPVLLTQADGICFEIIDAFLFTNYRGKVTTKVREIKGAEFRDRPLARSFLGLLLETSGLRMDTSRRDELKDTDFTVSPLNRHGVLHGIDCDYGTEANSLRVISLLSFLAEIDGLLSHGRD